MKRRTRRAFLGLAGGLAAGFAGCTGTGSTPADPSPETTTGSPTDSPTRTPTGTSGPTTFRFEPTAVPGDDARVVVYPTDLQGWLRQAARTGDTLRVHAETPVVMPEPPLPAFDRVRLTEPSGEADGWYAVQAQAGIRYRYLAGAVEATPPDDATVTPVSELDGERREFVLDAIPNGGSDSPRFYPETELGEWARTDFFGGYFRHAGTVYRGREVQQTDAAFFSRECWYVLSLEPVEGGPGPELHLADIEEPVREAVDAALKSRDPDEPGVERVEDPAESVVQFVEETDYLLAHSVVLTASVERH